MNEQTIKDAQNGNAEAQFKLAKSYYNGKGVEKDDAEAVKWLKKTAAQGHAQNGFI